MEHERQWVSGDPRDVLVEGLQQTPGYGTDTSNVQPVVESYYDVSLSPEAAAVVNELTDTPDRQALLRATTVLDFNRIDLQTVAEEASKLSSYSEPDTSDVLGLVNTTLEQALCDRSTDATRASLSKERDDVYLPELVGDGTVYMAKTINVRKLRIAWELDDANDVIVVDNYRLWEELFGWEKLKTLPNSDKKLVAEYGHQLSDSFIEQLDVSLGNDERDSDESTGTNTVTPPDKKVLNIGVSRSPSERNKLLASDVAEQFSDNALLDVGVRNADMLVLFPPSTDRLLSEHWWLAGSKPFGRGDVALANCNQGTYDYLAEHDQVWHVDNLIERATSYTFQTTDGPQEIGNLDADRLVVLTGSPSDITAFSKDGVFDGLPQAVTEYYDQSYRASTRMLPAVDEMIVGVATPTDLFWIRPFLNKHSVPTLAGQDVRDIAHTKGFDNMTKLYALARLHNWPADCPEMKGLAGLEKRMGLSFKHVGYHVIETLARTHDAGEEPSSASPPSWLN